MVGCGNNYEVGSEFKRDNLILLGFKLFVDYLSGISSLYIAYLLYFITLIRIQT